jgi:hypothetical protein
VRFLLICNQGRIVGFGECVLIHRATAKSRDAMNATKKIKDGEHATGTRTARPSKSADWCAMARLTRFPIGSEWRLARSGGRRRFLCGECLSLVRRVTRQNVGESSRIGRIHSTPEPL